MSWINAGMLTKLPEQCMLECLFAANVALCDNAMLTLLETWLSITANIVTGGDRSS